VAIWKPRVVVIGAGVGGLAAGVRLLQDGLDDLVIVDRADGVGGVWRVNTYPGAQCDVPSHLYSLSFHPKPDWKRRFGDQDEILAYLEEVSSAHGLAPHLRLRTEVTACEWDDAAEHWRVRMREHDGTELAHEADVVICAAGQLSEPAVPDLKGLDTFAGPAFHSARWRHDVDLTGRRIGVIGTGASAIQFVPAIAPAAAHLDLFQRSAPYTVGKANRRYSAREQRLYARVPGALAASRLGQYLWHELLGIPFTQAPWLMAIPARAWRRRMHRAVSDPELREKLTPDYTMGCKRVLLTTGWYRTLRRPDVAVITEQIAEILPDGVRTVDGEVHPLDVLIFGTGFAATRFLTPMRVTGRAGRELQDEWQHGARAYLGTAVPGFPNFFLLYGPGTNLGHSSIIFMIESQLAWIRSALTSMRTLGLRWIDVRPEVQSGYDARFRAASARTVWETGCTNWYLVDGKNTNNWPGTTIGFRRRTRRFRIEDVESGPLSAGAGPTVNTGR
jgi:cation diffusion facilitator CzcD-associated flavoprotein CzcO